MLSMNSCSFADQPEGKHSWIIEYWNAIQSGEIVAGQELKLQLRKLVGYITGGLVLSEPVIFAPEDSEKRIKFIETQCKHYQAPFAGKPFLLELFQKAFIEAIHAIKIWSDELGRFIRKYQEILFLVGRKNGKTPLIGAICLAEWFCGPMGQNIMCASNDYEQADLMFSAINSMREESPMIDKVTRRTVKGIYFGNKKQKAKKGKFTMQNKGSIKKLSKHQNNKEGRNLAIGAVDEVFEMEDDSLTMPIQQALSTQDEPLYFELTTEGFTNDGYLDHRLVYARKVLNDEVENERLLVWLYTQDSLEEIYQDESTWEKSNPGIGKIKKWSFLRNMLTESEGITSKLSFVLAKDFNFKQNNASAWLKKDVIANEDIFQLENMRGWVAIGGADLSETGDLTCGRILLVNPTNNHKYTMSHYFIPETKLIGDTEEEKIRAERYRKWAKEGWLTICPGEEVSDSDLEMFFIGMFKKYRIVVKWCGYDKWQARGFRRNMEDNGFDMEKIEQGFDLSNAMELVETDLKLKKLNYCNNPVDKYCLENTAAKWNSAGTKRMPVKVQGDSEAKIDGAVTLLICYETLSRHRSDYMAYAERKNVAA